MSSYITGALQVIQGAEAQKAAKTESRALRGQAALALSESDREAVQLQERNEEFEQRQRLSFLKSGVRLEGTPLEVLAETKRAGEEEVESIRESGVAQAGLFRSRGQILERRGRAAFIGSLGQASTSGAQGFKQQTGGVFSPRSR